MARLSVEEWFFVHMFFIGVYHCTVHLKKSWQQLWCIIVCINLSFNLLFWFGGVICTHPFAVSVLFERGCFPYAYMTFFFLASITQTFLLPKIFFSSSSFLARHDKRYLLFMKFVQSRWMEDGICFESGCVCPCLQFLTYLIPQTQPVTVLEK